MIWNSQEYALHMVSAYYQHAQHLGLKDDVDSSVGVCRGADPGGTGGHVPPTS